MATNNNELSAQNCDSAPTIYSLRQAAWTLGISIDELSRAIRRGTVRTVRRRRALVVTAEELTRHLTPPEPTEEPDPTETTLDALDRYRDVPTAVLARIVERECAAPIDDPEPPDAGTDAELAALICQSCRSPLACVELELRLHGSETVGVWGGLPDDQIRELCRGWLDRRGHTDPETPGPMCARCDHSEWVHYAFDTNHAYVRPTLDENREGWL